MSAENHTPGGLAIDLDVFRRISQDDRDALLRLAEYGVFLSLHPVPQDSRNSILKSIIKVDALLEAFVEVVNRGGVFGIDKGNLKALEQVISKNTIDGETLYALLFKTVSNDFYAAKRIRALTAAEKRHANSPKTREKGFVLECWKQWKSKPERYQSKAQFSRAMLDKCEHLISQKTIEDWCRNWEAEAKVVALPAQ